MNGERIRQIAQQCADQLMTGEHEWTPVIKQAIRQALVEVLSEEPSAEMQIAGFDAFCEAEIPHDAESAIYAAMCAEKRKEFEK